MKKFYSLKPQKTFTTLFLLMISVIMFSQTTHNISDPEALTGLSATLAAGDTVILADGIYTSEERIKFSPTTGTAAMPITFRPQTPGGVKFTNGLQLDIGGDYVVVDGFHWQGGYGASNFIQFRDGTDYANHSTIQNCAIDGLALSPDDIADDGTTSITKHRWVVLYGTYNSVINCSFMNKASAGALVLAEYQYNAEDDRCAIVGHTISNNYFYKYAKIDNTLSNSGDSETIRIGASDDQNVNSNVTVNNNYFVEADGENEIITNKSKNNTFTNNTFRRCRGSLVLRHGSNATVDQNYFLGEDIDGTGGIRISDSNHTITNNYIQDCITVASQAKWNNGITFIGGGDNAAVACTATGTTNGYQKSENITLFNNTIMNTNAPLFYNVNTVNNTDVKGTVSNNLIYFAAADPNLSDVISGDTGTSYDDIGTSNELIYTGNVYKGTNLGVTNTGFSLDNGITATADGEIFAFSGATGKGADMGTYEPTTDDMVGYGIGACFLDNIGDNITDGDCTIEIPESLTVSPLSTLTADAGSYDVSVYANVSWTAASDNPSWISIDITSGTGDATVSVAVTENTEVGERTGTVTFTQDAGGDDIVRTLNVTQEGVDLTDLYNLINIGTGLPTDQVQVIEFSQEQVDLTVDPPKENYAKNTLDKITTTRWAAEDGAILAGDYKGDGEYVIYDLEFEYELDLIQIATDDKSDPYGVQIWVSTTGTDPSDFTMVLPTTGDLLITTTVGAYDDYDQYEVDVNARYVKLMGYGRFNTDGDARQSAWSNITEIEFYGDSALSVDDFEFNKHVLVYPVPAEDNLNIKVLNNDIESVKIYSIQGQLILEEPVDSSNLEFSINLANVSSGTYVVSLSGKNGLNVSKMIIVSD